MSNVTFDESALDQLFQLQQKRLQAIDDRGTDFHILGGTEMPIKGLYDNEKSTITFPAGTPLRNGLYLNSPKSGELHVASITPKSGVIVADVLPVKGVLALMQCKNGAYVPAGSVPVVGKSGYDVTVPASSALPSGTVVKIADQLLTVSVVKRCGSTATLRLEPLPEPQKAFGLKYAKPPEVRQTPTTGHWCFK